MNLTISRRVYLEHRLKLSLDWTLTIEQLIRHAHIDGDDDEVDRLNELLIRERILTEAITHALTSNTDTFAVL